MTSLPEHQNSNLFDLVGRVALVTGSNRGNGYAIAKGLNEVGAKVIRIDIAFDSKLNTDDYEFDLTNIAEIPSLIEKISSKHGRIDALINNAGVSISSANPYNDIGAYDKTLAVNLHAAFSLCSTVCPVMAANKGGAIVNITSLGAELAFPDNPSYQISSRAKTAYQGIGA